MIKRNQASKLRIIRQLSASTPKPKKSPALIAAIVLALIVILLVPAVLFYSGAFNSVIKPSPQSSPTPGPYTTTTPFATNTPYGTSHPTSNPSVTPIASSPPTTSNHVTLTTGQRTTATSQTVGSAGGTVQVTDSSSPLYGLKVVVPEAATSDPVSFDVSYADVSSINGLPQGASVASKMIYIEVTGSSVFNKYDMFDKPVGVTLPYDLTAPNNDNSPVRFYWYDPATGKLDSTGFLSEDTSAHTITFLTGSFSDFLAVELDIALADLSGTSYSVDTRFRPATNGWFIPNYGSVLTPGGMCLGMVSYAKWYYTYHTADTGLHSKYIEGVPSEWRDDNTAIQLASRAHLATTGIWNSLTQEETNWAKANAREEGLSWLSGMIVTGEPQLIGLKARTNNGTWLNYAHAIMTYGYNNGHFEIYDPNFPGSSPGTAMREIPFDYNTGFSETYVSGTTRADSLVFNIFYHAGSKLSATPDDYQGLYESAQSGFTGSSVFPTVTLTDPTTTPEGTTPVDTNSDGIRDTTESKTVISGTITGGAETINSTLIFVDNNKYTAQVVGGAFSKEVPLLTGDNDVVILATDENTFSNWAGFLRDTIKSTASPAAMTVTLTWDQDSSDVDLHVQEPGTDGRHIYYSNKGYTDGNPFLDMDNTLGYGPEHYYATESMTLPDSTNLYGTYQIRVNYYADHSGADQTQSISWHLNVKYMAFKNVQTGQEFWVEESRSGSLSTADSSGTSDFYNSSPGWSNIWTIDYTAPNPQDYGIPPPPQNQFPA